MRIALFAFVIAAVSWSVELHAQTTPQKPQLLGMRLAQALGEDFFTFFRLGETSRERDFENRVVVAFKPTNTEMAKVVTVRATLDGQNTIVKMTLGLARSFVDSSPFAIDIAKSLLSDSLPGQDVTTVKTLIQELTAARAPADGGSAGALTYRGVRQSYSQELSSSSVRLENLIEGGQIWLNVQVSLNR